MNLFFIITELSVDRFNHQIDFITRQARTSCPVKFRFALVARRFDRSKVLFWKEIIIRRAGVDFGTVIVFGNFPSVLTEIILKNIFKSES